ncbi:MAG: hypothetical protein M3Z92_09315 [Bacteroidota bacterium]|nr:hypothetical protein [Bacteroidota bacterium]
MSYDKFNQDYKNVYKLSSHFNSDGEKQVWSGVPGPLAVFAKTMPEVQSIVRTQNGFDQVLSNKDRTKIFDGNDVAVIDRYL